MEQKLDMEHRMTAVLNRLATAVEVMATKQDQSTVDNNSWTPDGYPAGWSEVSE